MSDVIVITQWDIYAWAIIFLLFLIMNDVDQIKRQDEQK